MEDDHADDHVVKVNIFISFKEWPNRTTLYPTKDGLGKNLQEVVLRSKTAEFHFDRDIYDIAFFSRRQNLPGVEPSFKGLIMFLFVISTRMKKRFMMGNSFLSRP